MIVEAFMANVTLSIHRRDFSTAIAFVGSVTGSNGGYYQMEVYWMCGKTVL